VSVTTIIIGLSVTCLLISAYIDRHVFGDRNFSGVT